MGETGSVLEGWAGILGDLGLPGPLHGAGKASGGEKAEAPLLSSTGTRLLT